MPRGGRRSGKPGAQYPNRADLAQSVRTAPNQPYGQAGAQAQAQRTIPLPQTPPTPAPQPTVNAPDPGMLAQPTARPGEPVTAGLPIGAGPGPEANAVNPSDQVLPRLYQAYKLNPTQGLLDIIRQAEALRGPVS